VRPPSQAPPVAEARLLGQFGFWHAVDCLGLTICKLCTSDGCPSVLSARWRTFVHCIASAYHEVTEALAGPLSCAQRRIIGASVATRPADQSTGLYFACLLMASMSASDFCMSAMMSF
jgi:hypothetical protein